jgi:hypothetical protein
VSAVTGQSPARAIGGAVRGADLTIGGMTCASCAARIEKELNKLDRVTATVNFATEVPARPGEHVSGRRGWDSVIPRMETRSGGDQ